MKLVPDTFVARSHVERRPEHALCDESAPDSDSRRRALSLKRCVSPMNVSLFVYWVVFVWLAIGAGRNPGFVGHPEAVAYPVQGVSTLCVVLALLVALLRLVLRPPLTWRRWARLALRASYVLLLIFLLLPATATDMPGIEYVPAKFSFVTLLMLAVWAVLPHRGRKDGPSRTVA
jgi:hypothetical protein